MEWDIVRMVSFLPFSAFTAHLDLGSASLLHLRAALRSHPKVSESGSFKSSNDIGDRIEPRLLHVHRGVD